MRRLTLRRFGSRWLWDSGLWPAFLLGRRKAIMAGKDKGGRSAKTPAAKSAKEKRQDKKDKKASKGTMPI